MNSSLERLRGAGLLDEAPGTAAPDLQRLLRAAVLCNDARLVGAGEGVDPGAAFIGLEEIEELFAVTVVVLVCEQRLARTRARRRAGTQ